MVRARKEVDKTEGAMGPSMAHEVDSPFSMDQIRTSIMDECLARERANLVQVRMEPDTRLTHPGLRLTKSDPIMIETDIKANCAVAEPTAWGIETQESKKRVKHAKETMSTEEFRMAKFGKIQGNSA